MNSARFVRAAVLAATCIAAVGWACHGSSSSGSAPTSLAVAAPATQPQCDPALWAHVYDPGRLKINQPCQTVTGVVMEEYPSEDGDVDMGVAVDPQYAGLLNDGNRANLKGWLQTEAICQAAIKPSSPDAARACGTYQGSVLTPPVGAHVQVTGTYVLDTRHGWMELHPISVVEVR